MQKQLTEGLQAILYCTAVLLNSTELVFSGVECGSNIIVSNLSWRMNVIIKHTCLILFLDSFCKAPQLPVLYC